MMLTTSFFQPTMPHYSPYTPPRSSPLSERSLNATTPSFNFAMSSPSEKKPTTPQRAFKPNPVMQTRDAATKRRRDMFFARVQNNREDKKWEARGEQIQQLDFVSERKRWEALKARQAPPEEEGIVEEDAMLATEMTEADHVAAQEEYELQQLVAMREEEEKRSSQHYGSDDEDYDSIFMDCATAGDEWYQQQQQSQEQQLRFGSGEETEMDMTDG
jgi:hypothetical protein